MMKIVFLAALVASASAFAPASQQRASSALAESPFAKEIGAQMPVSENEIICFHLCFLERLLINIPFV
jgi:hypothetical protein